MSWQKFFGNDNSITLELACGKGDYTLALAKIFPQQNFIDIDIKGARLWRGAKTALQEELINVAFLRVIIEELKKYFNQKQKIKNLKSPIINQVTDIWITFPDPFPKKRQIKKLTSPRFLKMYKKILNPTDGQALGRLHLKINDLNLLNYSVETVSANGWHIKTIIHNIYAQNNLDPLLQIQIFYEHRRLAAGKRIHYLYITP